MKYSKEAKVGALAVVAIAILYIGFNFLKGVDFFDPTKTYYVVYKEVAGLTNSNPVKINGFRVGRVGSTKLLQEGGETRILVGIEVSDDLVLYEGTEAVLEDDGILGSKAIKLNITNKGRLLNAGDTLLGSTDKSLAEMIQERADPIVAEVDTTLHRVNHILSGLTGSGMKVDRVVDELHVTAEALKFMVMENRRDINAIAQNLRGLTETLNDDKNGIKPFLVKMNQMADSLNSLELKQTVNNANQAIANIESLTKGLQEGNGSLGMLLKDDSLYNNLNKSSEDLDKLLMDIRKNPGRYLDLRFSILGIGK